MSQLFISAAHKSSGKTLISIGLCCEFRARDLTVQPFKKGPDYIDPAWLASASERACYNLDFNTQSVAEIQHLYDHQRHTCQISLIEANKGLYDGLSHDGSDSNAALAKQLGCPVILVIDCGGMTRGIAPLLKGYREFDHDINIAGVILNQVVGDRHRSKLIAAVEEYTDIKVLGAVDRNPELSLTERHLGLIPAAEMETAGQKIHAIRTAIAEQVDVDTILETIAVPQEKKAQQPPPTDCPSVVKIGIFADAAFSFYYPDDLQAFGRCGAKLIPINSLHDQELPEVDGLFIGGGFPETQAFALENNAPLREQVGHAIEAGMPVYAECGGLMYLSRSIAFEGKTYDMCGIIQADTVLHEKPQGRGYVAFTESDAMPWPGKNASDHTYRAHEFHYSSLTHFAEPPKLVIEVTRGAGVMDAKDGIVYKNLIASYLHRRNSEQDPWVERFVEFVKSTRD